MVGTSPVRPMPATSPVRPMPSRPMPGLPQRGEVVESTMTPEGRPSSGKLSTGLPGVETPAQAIPEQPQVQSAQKQEPKVMRVEETSTFDAAKLAEKDPETHAKFVARQREIVKEKEAELEKRSDLSPMAKNVERQRIQSQAFQIAAREFAPQAAKVNAASVETTISAQPQPPSGVSRLVNTASDFADTPPATPQPTPMSSPNVGDMSVQNQDLQRQQIGAGQAQPVIVNNNNNSSTERVISPPAQPRVESTFSRYQESRFMPAW